MALKYQTADQAGYAFNKIAIAILISLYLVVFLNDLLAMCNYLDIFKPKNKKISKNLKAIDNKNDEEDGSTNQDYDARFKSIEQRLFQSIFHKKHNRIGNAHI